MVADVLSGRNSKRGMMGIMDDLKKAPLEFWVNRLSEIQVGESAVLGGIIVRRIDKQRWIIEEKRCGIKVGAKRLRNATIDGAVCYH